jgi:hypothetical protein
MYLRSLCIVVALASSSTASAADFSDRASPADSNAACMDRAVDASSGNCILKEEGTPRRAYAPKSSATTPAPRTGNTTPSPAVKGSGNK